MEGKKITIPDRFVGGVFFLGTIAEGRVEAEGLEL